MVLWIALALSAALLAWGFFQMARGRLNLDLGWGRTRHALGPVEVRIRAPRDLVFETMAAPYLGRRAPEGIEILERTDDLVVAAHHTKVHFYTARTVEAVGFEAPGRITFRHLQGPVPEAREAFALSRDGDHTVVRYTGEIGIDFWFLGRIAARWWVVPQWESKVRPHLEDLVGRCERRADARAKRDRRA